MNQKIQELYKKLTDLPVSELAKQDVGSFMLYDSLLAGYASRAVNGEYIDISKIPVPNQETIVQVKALREKENLTEDERTYMAHFDLLEEIRLALCTPSA